MDWTRVPDAEKEYNANAAQTRVIGTILNICIYVAGGLKNIIPKVFWMSFQANIHFRTNNTIFGGSIILNTDINSAALCADFLVQVCIV